MCMAIRYWASLAFDMCRYMEVHNGPFSKELPTAFWEHIHLWLLTYLLLLSETVHAY